MRKGYYAEYLCKKRLIKKFGYMNVIKVAIGSFGVDFIVLKPESKEVEKLVEVKSTKREKWYPKPRDKKQFKTINRFSKSHQIPVEYWIKRGRKRFKVFRLNEFKDKYLRR